MATPFLVQVYCALGFAWILQVIMAESPTARVRLAGSNTKLDMAAKQKNVT